MGNGPRSRSAKQVGDQTQKRARVVGAFGVKSVCNHSAWDRIGSVISSTHSNNQHLWKATADHRQKLEAGHLRHVKVRNNQLRYSALHLQESIETMLCGRDFISFGSQQHCHCRAVILIVINYEDWICWSVGHWGILLTANYSGSAAKRVSICRFQNLFNFGQLTRVHLCKRATLASREERHSRGSCEFAE